MPLHLSVTAAEVEAAFAPAIHREIAADDRDWRRLERRLRVALAWQALLGRVRPRRSRRGASAKVSESYERTWANEQDFERFTLPHHKPQPMVWGSRRFFASQIGAKRVHLLYLARLIQALQPRSVLEVGSGMGQNTLLLAAMFPAVAFIGAELTAHGTRTAARTARADTLPEVLRTYAPAPLAEGNGQRGARFVRASASHLPFASGAFDLVYTVQALEQMEAIRHQALAEVARVSGGHVAMVEPFREWNHTPLRRSKTGGWGLFSGAISDLPALGLMPVHVTDDMPTKLYYGVGLVVARKA